MSLWSDPELTRLFTAGTPLIDVRSPGEFQEGSIPYSVNMPIMNDEERAKVGTCYKEQGQAAAISLGHQLVSGHTKDERIEGWRDYIRKNPSAEVFCFRGGLRSQITCQWINLGKTPVTGGYKRMRRFFLSWLDEAPLPDLIRIGGPTGSLKTEFIQNFTHIDLEELANHRGSAFGNRGPQPSQITFENNLALRIMNFQGRRIVVEDESATMGKISMPRRLFAHQRLSPMLVLEVSLEDRIKNIFDVYVRGNNEEFFLTSLEKIRKSLGGVNFIRIQGEMKEAFASGQGHELWISDLLRNYYDPIYNRDLIRQKELILCRGTREELTEFLKKA